MSKNIVSEFEAALHHGLFKIPRCNTCRKIVWPPIEFCDACLGTVSLEHDPQVRICGRIIECSESRQDFARHGINNTAGFFCLVEIKQAIRIMASLSKTAAASRLPGPGSRVILKSCGINPADSSYVFDVEMCDQEDALDDFKDGDDPPSA